MADEEIIEPEQDGSTDSEDVLGFGENVEGVLASDDDLFDFDEILAEYDGPADLDINEILAGLDDSDEPEPDEAPETARDVAPPDAAPELTPPHPGERSERERKPERPARTRITMLSPVGLLLGLFTVLNLGLIGFTWKLSNDVQSRVDAATVDMLQVTRDIVAKTGEQVEKRQDAEAPVVSPEPEGTETLLRAEADIQAGEYAAARRRLYALLAISDRLDEELREDITAHARFLLADSLTHQALAEDRP